MYLSTVAMQSVYATLEGISFAVEDVTQSIRSSMYSRSNSTWAQNTALRAEARLRWLEPTGWLEFKYHFLGSTAQKVFNPRKLGRKLQYHNMQLWVIIV